MPESMKAIQAHESNQAEGWPTLQSPRLSKWVEEETNSCSVRLVMPHWRGCANNKTSNVHVMFRCRRSITGQVHCSSGCKLSGGLLMRDGLIVIPQNKFNHPELKKSGWCRDCPVRAHHPNVPHSQLTFLNQMSIWTTSRWPRSQLSILARFCRDSPSRQYNLVLYLN